MIHSLDTNGAIFNKKASAVRLLKNFLISDYSQSSIYLGNVSSLRFIFSQFDNRNVIRLMSDIEAALISMYRRYFDNVDINVYNKFENEDKVVVELQIDITIIDDNDTIKLSEIINREEIESLYSNKT